MTDFEGIRALTFDCYGTLIDWERGLLAALRPFMERCGRAVGDDEVLMRYAVHEAMLERPPFRSYKDVMRGALLALGKEMGFGVDREEADALSASIAMWPAFPDTAAALRTLGSRFRLCVCSNIDRDLFAWSAPKLGVTLDALVTVDDVGSYKPAHGHFHRAMEVLGVGRGEILHVAQSLHHDIVPARELGLRSVWVNRQAGRWGATLPVAGEVRADLEVPDLAAIARVLCGA